LEVAMKGRWTVLALAVGVSAAPALAGAQGHAVPRGGGSEGSSGGSSHGSSAGGSHHSGGDSHSSSGSSSSGSSSGHSSSSSGPRTDAERRHPRPGTGTGDRYYYYGSPYYYGRQYYYNAYDPFYYGAYGYGYTPFYYSGSYGYAPYYYGGRYSDGGSLRVLVDPVQTRVYVDGYYAGIADDFDGIFQRLNVPPGRHDITLKLEGYRTHRFRVYVPVNDTIKIHHEMVRGSGEETDEVVGEPQQYLDERGRERDTERDAERDDHYARRDEGREDDRDDADAGTLRLELRPSDASVYVDGEFRGSGRRAESLRLAPGRHRLEVVRPGYRTVERDIDVRPREDTRVEIELGR
jgi:hypothetical protein